MIFAKRAVMEADASRPHAANFLESDGRVPWVGVEKLEVLVGELTDRLGQLAVMKSGLRRGKMVQSGVQRPASKSAFARLPAASKRPARLSASI